VDNVPYISGRAPAAACVRWVPKTPTLLHVIPRPGKTDAQVGWAGSGAGAAWLAVVPFLSCLLAGTAATAVSAEVSTTCQPPASLQGRPLEARCFTAPPLFIFHHANAYETEDGRRLIIDSIHYDSLPAVGREALVEQQASAHPRHAQV
jgi:all-trans-8'-apo-beta-carotenal 15,15'-oxygenase